MIIPACRSMCLQVKERCEPILIRFNFAWPETLDCSNLPERSDRSNLCIDPPPLENGIGEDEEDDDKTIESEYLSPSGKITQNSEWMKLLDALRGRSLIGGSQSVSVSMPSSSSSATSRAYNECPDRFVMIDRWLDGANRSQCLPRCGIDVLFRSEDKRFMEKWMIVWSSVCLVTTSFTLITFLLDPVRFKYPQRPVIFLSISYLFHSVSYLIRAVVGPNLISCGGSVFLIRDGLESVWCIVTFVFFYYFFMAGATWWSVLALTWFLASCRKWGREAIQSYGGYFHLVAWTLPGLQTIIVLVLRRIDGDELTGFCSTGIQHRTAMAAFIVVPFGLYFLTGSGFIIAGFAAMFQIRKELKEQEESGNDVTKLEKLMAKIVIFSIVFSISSTSVLSSYIYEMVFRNDWLNTAMVKPCSRNVRSGKEVDCSLESSIPSIYLFTWKIFISLMVGPATTVWLWSSKTFSTWKSFLFGRRWSGRGRRKTESGRSGSFRTVHPPSSREIDMNRGGVGYQANDMDTIPPLLPPLPPLLPPSPRISYVTLNKGSTSLTTII